MSFFVNQICCCSPAVASQVLAVIALIAYSITGGVYYINDTYDYVTLIVQAVLFIVEGVACILVFIACCQRKPVLMIPIMIISPIHALIDVGFMVYNVIAENYYYYDAGSIVYMMLLILIQIGFELFVLWTHICCYIQLIFAAANPHTSLYYQQQLHCAGCHNHYHVQPHHHLQQPQCAACGQPQPPYAAVHGNPQQLRPQNMQQHAAIMVPNCQQPAASMYPNMQQPVATSGQHTIEIDNLSTVPSAPRESE
ncbi:hypothetical protein PFISCL1PPCAC_17932 [Pristionchus fissidentatus]|uniref:Uncharacterized protein n=1 Tax=Pristionchus fissidentatus TaxID=1538716 RepID=A0AAV5W7Q2_9BILA|nr:hypothetical protein PFISCL1PPCAC_17932 [Pristionchus fissidentatus]